MPFQRSVIQRAVNAVGHEHNHVAALQTNRLGGEINRRFSPLPQITGQGAAAQVFCRFLPRKQPLCRLLMQGCGIIVLAVERHQLSAAQEGNPAVTNADEVQHSTADVRHNQRRARARICKMRLHHVQDIRGQARQRLAHVTGHVRESLQRRVHRCLAQFAAALHAAHAVCKHRQHAP